VNDKPTPRPAATPSRDPVPTPSPVTPSPVPTPFSGDGDEHPVPDPVPDRSSWMPSNIISLAASRPEPPQVVGLLYPGLFHLVSGESEALKTWLAAIAATEELAAGRGVLWIDGDDVGSGVLLERLRALGADDDAIARRFAYVLPDQALDDDSRKDLLGTVRGLSCRLAVFDGFNPLLHLQHLDPNVGTDVEAFYRLLDPIRRTGVAVVVTDNVVKSAEARGGWAIGSERKRSKAQVHLGMKALVPLVRGGTGKARIDVHKDRPGWLQRPSPGVLVLDTTDAGCSWRIDPDASRAEGGEFRPTHLMERVSRHLEVRGEPDSQTQIEEKVRGKAVHLRAAMDRLRAEGYVVELEGPRGMLLRLERPFREAEDAEAERLAEVARQAQQGDLF
jgi:hypothetical protein